MYAKYCAINPEKLISQHVLSLKGMHAEACFSSSEPEFKNGIMILSPKKSFKIYATESYEQINWLSKLKELIIRHNVNCLHTRSFSTLFTPTENITKCMRCQQTKFGLFNRKHHCFSCGMVVCGDCSKHRFMWSNQFTNELKRICEECTENLKMKKKSKINKYDLESSQSFIID